MSQSLSLTIDGNLIPQDETGLYSLNDLHKASGGLDKHSPRRWQQLVRTRNLLAQLDSECDLSTEIPSIKSSNKAGTFVCTELVYAYAMAISPKFELKVIRGFHAAAVKEHRLAKMHGNAMWCQNRALGKYQRKEITDSIQLYIDYANAQGSKGAQHYYTNITSCVNKALGIEDRDKAGEDMLALLAVAEIVAERVLLEGMSAQLPYKNIYEGIKQQITIFAAMVADEEVISD